MTTTINLSGINHPSTIKDFDLCIILL